MKACTYTQSRQYCTHTSVLSTYMPEGTTWPSPLCILNTEQYGYLHVTALHSKSNKTLPASDRHRALPNPLNPLCGLLSLGTFHAGQLHRIYSTGFGVSKLTFFCLCPRQALGMQDLNQRTKCSVKFVNTLHSNF